MAWKPVSPAGKPPPTHNRASVVYIKIIDAGGYYRKKAAAQGTKKDEILFRKVTKINTRTDRISRRVEYCFRLNAPPPPISAIVARTKKASHRFIKPCCRAAGLGRPATWRL